MRKFIIFLIVGTILGAGSWFGYQFYQAGLTTVKTSITYETVTVARSTMAQMINTNGTLKAQAQIGISFRTTGRIAKVLVTPSQSVTAGEVLAELDTTDLLLALAQAKVSLAIAQADVAKLKILPEEPSLAKKEMAVQVAKTKVSAAESALHSAQVSYDAVLAGPTAAEQLVNLAQVKQAEAEVKMAQQLFNEVRNLPNVGELPQAAQLEQATVRLEVAKAQAAIAQQPSTPAKLAAALNEIAQAKLTVQQAQSDLLTAQENLNASTAESHQIDLQIAEAKVQQAQLSQAQAEYNLRNAQLVAPFSGTISQVNIQEGEATPSILPAIVVSDLQHFYIDAMVDEIDVSQLETGQVAQISIDALPDITLTGVVSRVANIADSVNGVVTYRVTIQPGPNHIPWRVGMNAVATITTTQLSNVLVVPNHFIQLDRQANRAFVYKMVENQPTSQMIELGVSNEQVSQVLTGLTDGDVVVLLTQSSEEQLRSNLFGR